MSEFQTPLALADLGQVDTGPGSGLNTGDLRRTYALPIGSGAVAELSPDTTSFFRMATKFSTLPTDDPQYKYTEARSSLNKRYAYVTGWQVWASGGVPTTGYTVNSSDVSSLIPQTLNSTMALELKADYKRAGNIQNIFGQSTTKIDVGSTGTRPAFIIPNQLLKINTKATATGTDVDDYFIVRVIETASSGEATYITCKVIRPLRAAANKHLCSFTSATTPISEVYAYALGHSSDGTKAKLETMRTYVIGTGFLEGSGYPDSWKDDPYSTVYGQTQIWKTSLSMTNTARATVTKIRANEWARLWEQKLLEHKWDINNDILFGALATDDDGYRYTEGIINYILGNCATFDFATTGGGAKTADDLLHDLAVVLDPRTGNGKSMVFFVNTEVYHYMNTLGGYQLSNLKIGNNSGAANYQFQFDSKKDMFGVAVSKFSTLYQDMYVARELALDGTNIQMVGVNFDYIKWRPLVGNGINRDTHIIIDAENKGIDARVDYILTEGGMQCNIQEAHAVWVKA